MLNTLGPCLTSAPAHLGEARLISRYGTRPSRRTGEPRLHAGIDIGASRGTRLYAPRAGVVVRVGADADGRRGGLYGYGNAVVIHHQDEGIWTLYAHLQAALVTEGLVISAGTPLGLVGASTNGKFPGMGAHLHLEARHAKPDGSAPFPGRYGAHNVDPAGWLEQHGLTFGRRGRFEMTADVCVPPPVLSNAAEAIYQASLPLLAVRAEESDPNAAYEPVSADPDLFAPPSPLGPALAALPLAALGLGAAWAALRRP